MMSDSDRGVLVGSATSSTGRISVETTELGLPLSMVIDRSELRCDPGELGTSILRLCRQAAGRARMARRAELAQAGVAPDVLDRIGLPTTEDIALAELTEEAEHDYAPRSWLQERP
jgi:hypothetical protein